MHYLVNRQIEKIAVGPAIYITKGIGESSGLTIHPKAFKDIDKMRHGALGKIDPIPFLTGGRYSLTHPKVRKSGLIYINKGSTTLPWVKGQNTLSHELTHWLRRQKGKWSARRYGKNPLATVVEEVAAYRRGGAKFPRALQGGVATLALKKHRMKLFNLLKKLSR